ncbi:hypothetical protein L3X38_003786 [Prunus dulcis]|uniref:Uncharacterized protein n=1 Tax=Prunus dulcis TaxID=3755 RepID=A0AAD4ZMR2_PRUDU|nr:hypothetical protein L3X38_003786 [Prunus dulcis]
MCFLNPIEPVGTPGWEMGSRGPHGPGVPPMLPSNSFVIFDNASRVSGTPEPCGARIAARVDLVPLRPARNAARVDLLSPRPTRNADQLTLCFRDLRGWN